MAIPQGNEIVPDPTILRLPTYLDYLLTCRDGRVKVFHHHKSLKTLGLTGIQVRKDLARFQILETTSWLSVEPLIEDIRTFLGYDREKIAFLAGAGHLGTALLHYQGFADYGIKIVAAFDTDPELQYETIGQTPVHPVEDIAEQVAEHDPQMMIICVPADQAQGIADASIAAGIKVFWNFAPTTLNVADDVIVQNMNMAQSLALLSNRAMMFQQRMEAEEAKKKV